MTARVSQERTVVLLQTGDLREYIVVRVENSGTNDEIFKEYWEFYITDSVNRYPYASDGVLGEAPPHYKWGPLHGRFVIAVQLRDRTLRPGEVRYIGAGALRVKRATVDGVAISLDDPCLEFDGPEQSSVHVVFPFRAEGWAITTKDMTACTHVASTSFIPSPDEPRHVQVRGTHPRRPLWTELVKLDVRVAMLRAVVAADACGEDVAILAPAHDDPLRSQWDSLLSEIRFNSAEPVATRQASYRAHLRRLQDSRPALAARMPSMPDTVSVLYLASSPVDATTLGTDEEAREIRDELQRAELRDKFEFVVRQAVRAEDLQRHVLRERPVVLHFSGHGAEDEGLVFEDRDRLGVIVSAGALARLLKAAEGPTRVVLLNACYSAHHVEELAKAVDVVIAMTRVVQDHAAVRFAAAFYRALAFGSSVSAAFNLAVNELEILGITGETDVPSMHTRAGVIASDIFLAPPR